MSSIELFTDGDSGLEQSRRSTRQRKQTQHFGYSGSDSQAEGLVSKRLNRPLSLMTVVLAFARSPRFEGHDKIAIMQVTDRGKERATKSPSFVIKLSLPRIVQHEPVLPPPCREAESPYIKADKKREFGCLLDGGEGSDQSTPILTGEPATKRQRLALRMNPATQENGGPGKPAGQPDVWAEVIHIQEYLRKLSLISHSVTAGIMRVATILPIISLGCVCLGQLKWVCRVCLQLPPRQRQRGVWVHG